MNTLSRLNSFRHVGVLGRRFVAGAPVGISHAVPNTKPITNTNLPKEYQYSARKIWLGDPSTYPLFVAMLFAGALIVGFSANAMFRYKGIKWSEEERHSPVALTPEFKEPHTPPVVEVLGGKERGPIAFHARKFTTLRHEGLGVDHQKWKESKEAEGSDTSRLRRNPSDSE